MALVENNPGSVKFESPLLIAHGDENGLVPSVASDALATRLCGLGQVLEYRLFDKGGAMLNGEPAQRVGRGSMRDSPVKQCRQNHPPVEAMP